MIVFVNQNRMKRVLITENVATNETLLKNAFEALEESYEVSYILGSIRSGQNHLVL